MERVLLIISENEEIQRKTKDAMVELERVNTRFKFVKKQFDDLEEQKKKISQRVAGEIFNIMKSMGKIPADWDERNDGLGININSDFVIWHRHDEHCTPWCGKQVAE